MFSSLVLFLACQKSPDTDKPPVTDPIGTILKLTPSNNSPVYGENVVFTAQLSANEIGGRLPQGYISFKMDDTIVCDRVTITGDAVNEMSANCKLPIEAVVGSHIITAHYAGDEDAYAASSQSTVYNIQPLPTTVQLIADKPNPTYGESVFFTATVNLDTRSEIHNAKGTIQFKIDDKVIDTCDSKPLNDNQATCTTQLFLDVGKYPVIAIYNPENKNYAGSEKSIDGYLISLANTYVDITALPDNPKYGQSVLFTATVRTDTPDKNGDPLKGTIAFSLDGKSTDKTCDSVQLDEKKQSRCTFDILVDAGKHEIKADFTPDSQNYNKSFNSKNDYTVSTAKTTLDLQSSSSNPVYDQKIKITAKLDTEDGISEKAEPPLGTVNFNLDGKPIASCQSIVVNNQQAICDNFIVPGTDDATITAEYVPSDKHYQISNGYLYLKIRSQTCEIKSTTIDYNTMCTAENGCRISMTCDNSATTMSKVLNNSKASMTKPHQKDEPKIIFTVDSTKGDYIKSIDPNFPALLETKDHIGQNIPSSWYVIKQSDDDKQDKLTLNCAVENSNIVCSGFAPVGQNFTMKGTLSDDTGSAVSITLDDISVTPMPNSDSTQLCGQFGTTHQRIFDCSMRVKNYAGFGTGAGDNGFTPFTLGQSDPDQNWFLVSCPGTDNQECFWLSPVMTKDNPSLANDEFDSLGHPMIDYSKTDDGRNGRLLWSGVSKKSYDFFEANGKNPYKVPDAYYDFYPENSAIPIRKDYIYNPLSTSTPRILPDDGVSEIYSAVQNETSLCSPASVSGDITLLSGKAYEWQMPSYPMAFSLTGGGEYKSGEKTWCESENYPSPLMCNSHGFRAISKLPGFTEDGFFLSSIYGIKNQDHPDEYEIGPYTFLILGLDNKSDLGVIFPGSFVLDNNESVVLPIRCVSGKW